MIRRFASLVLSSGIAGLGLSGCATTGSGADLTPEAAPAFVAAAASSDLFEIESSRLALQRTQNPMLRMHAEWMIRDHTNTSTQLRAAARSVGLGVPMQLLPRHAAMLDELSRAGGNFDGVYHRQQVASHQQALALMINYARRGDVPRLRGAAAAGVPVIRGHLDHLRM